MIKEVLDSEKVFVIHNFLSKEECAALIRRSEALAYEPSTVAGVMYEDVRNKGESLSTMSRSPQTCFNALNPSCRLSLRTIALSGSTNGGVSTGINLVRPSTLIGTGISADGDLA